jgi:Leucine-rich repeat (LRR) protein
VQGIYTGSNDGVIDWAELNKLGVAKLRRVPEVLFQMNWVSSLILDNNNIMILPPDMKQLKSLVKLSVRGNQLEELPDELKRCRSALSPYRPNS